MPSTLDNQAYGVLAALEAVGAELPDVDMIVHGTTTNATTTNAVLERKLARTGLITTRSFRDMLELDRRTRPQAYGIYGDFTPIISRDLRLEVGERMLADGTILEPLDTEGLRAAGFDNLLTYDMGGTSTEVALIRDARPAVSSKIELEYAMPIHVAMADVRTVGAGGGAIARINTAGLLEVGPQSAGADPGPICYGRGSTQPTISDANLLLGRLTPPPQTEANDIEAITRAARAIFALTLGAPLGPGPVEAIEAGIPIANAHMAGAIRMVPISLGVNPRDFTLFAFGGAGPLHAGALARELGVPRVLIPCRPGITNALGGVVADLRLISCARSTGRSKRTISAPCTR